MGKPGHLRGAIGGEVELGAQLALPGPLAVAQVLTRAAAVPASAAGADIVGEGETVLVAVAGPGVVAVVRDDRGDCYRVDERRNDAAAGGSSPAVPGGTYGWPSVPNVNPSARGRVADSTKRRPKS